MADRSAQQPAAPDRAALRRIFPRFSDEAERFAHYAEMRRRQPVQGDADTGIWSVYRYTDVRRVLFDHDAFSSEGLFAPPPGDRRDAGSAGEGLRAGAGAPGPAAGAPTAQTATQAGAPAAPAATQGAAAPGASARRGALAGGATPAGAPSPSGATAARAADAANEGADAPAARDPGAFLRRTLLNTDPPRHTRLRGLVTRAFTPRAVQRMEPLIRDLTRQALAPALARGSMDVMAELARPVPIAVIARMLGLPPEDETRFRGWAETFNSTQDLADAPDDPQSLQSRFRRMQDEMSTYFAPVIEGKRRAPADDLVTHLTQAEVDGERLAPEDLEAFCQLLLLAGFVTTTNLIGNGLWLLGRHPAALAALRADPALVPACVEEILRYLSPVQAFGRRAARPLAIAGASIPAGARVVAWIGSANRDEEAFPDAGAFVPSREPNPHLAFGHGIHFCLGAPLARLEGRVVLEELARGVAALEMAADSEPVDFSAGLLYGPARLRVDLRAG